MKIGIFGVISHKNVPPVDVALEVAKRGFDSFYTGEHHHFPVSTPTPDFYEEVPDYYKYVPDPFIVLAMMATAAPKLRVGTTICLVPIHDTIILANRIGSLDVLTNGRVIIGMGVGWNKTELAHHGVDFDTRSDKLQEQVHAMKKLWGDEPASFDGKFVKFEASWQGPKPIQKPHPPLLLGGRALKKNFRIIIDCCDGWMPTDTYEKTYGGNLETQLDELNAGMRAAGRDPNSLKNLMLVAETGLYDRNPTQYAQDAPTRDTLARFERLGFDRVAIGVPLFSREHFVGALEHLEKVAEPWLR